MKHLKRDNKPQLFKQLPRSVRFRVGWTPQDRLVWLLDFIKRTDLAVLKDADLIHAVGEVARFAHASDDFKLPKLTGADLELAARLIEAGIAKLFAGPEPWTVELSWPYDKDSVRRVRRTDPKTRDVSISFFTKSLGLALALAAQELVAANFDALEKCGECGTIFLRVKRQAFCSARCAQTVRSRRWRAKPNNRKKLNEWRRNRYRSEVAKIQGREIDKVRIQGKGSTD